MRDDHGSSPRSAVDRQEDGGVLEAFVRLFSLSEAPISHILDVALDEVLAITGSDVGYIYFYDEGLRTFTLHSWSKGVMDACLVVEKKTAYHLDLTGIWGDAVRTRRALVINDFQAAHPDKRGYPEGHVALRNFLTIPVFHADAIVAVIGVGNKNGAYGAEDIDRLELFAKGVWSLVLRKQTETALVESEQTYRSLVETNPEAMLTVSSDMRILYANKAASILFGMDGDEIRAVDLYGLVASEGMALHDIVNECRDGATFRGEVSLKRKDGVVFDAVVSAAIVESLSESQRFSVVVRDVTRRKQAERDLKSEKEFTEKIIDSQIDTFFVFDPNSGKAIRWNKAFRDISGYSNEEIEKINVTYSYYGQNDLQKIQSFTEKIECLGRGRIDLTLICKDGHTVDTEYEVSRVLYGPQNTKYYIAVGRDITERKRLETESKEQLAFIKALADAIPSPVYCKDTNDHRIWFNKAYMQFHGRSDLSGKTSVEVVGQEAAEFHLRMEKAMYENNQAIAYEYEAFTATGDIREIIFHKAPFVGAEGTVKGMIGVMTDITDRKRAEQELRQSEEIFKRILTGIRAGIVIVDPQTFTIVDVNSIAAGILGVSKEDLTGEPCTSVHWIRARDGLREEECPLLQGDIVHEEYRIERPGGSSVPINKTVISGVRAGQPLLYEVIFDMSAQKALERQLALAQRLESIGGLAAGIAHEINTPIQYIGDNLKFLEDAYSSMTAALGDSPLSGMTDAQAADFAFILEETPKALSQSCEGVARVAEIVKAMKRFSHMGGEEKFLLDVPSAIENVILVARNEWKYHAEIRQDRDPAVRHFLCYPGDFNQVLLNLLVNASHAVSEKYKDTEGKGTITIATREEQGDLVLSVADTGCGIPEKNLHRVFDPFFTTKEVGKGTGQGLALVHDIMRKHGGTVEVVSKQGEGATFILRFPLNEEEKNGA